MQSLALLDEKVWWLTKHAHLNRGSVNSVDIGATYQPEIVGMYPLVIPPVVVDGSNYIRRWPGVNPGIILYSFIDLGRMEGWVGLAARGCREICWYDLHGESNSGCSHGSTLVYPNENGRTFCLSYSSKRAFYRPGLNP